MPKKELQYIWVEEMTFLALVLSLSFGLVLEKVWLNFIMIILGGLAMGRLFFRAKEISKVYATIIATGYILGFITASILTIDLEILLFVILAYIILYVTSVYLSYWMHKNKKITSVEF